MDVLVPFAAALLSLRLTALVLGRYRARRAPELLAWAASLACFAAGSAALAWGAAAGWDDRSGSPTIGRPICCSTGIRGRSAPMDG